MSSGLAPGEAGAGSEQERRGPHRSGSKGKKTIEVFAFMNFHEGVHEWVHVGSVSEQLSVLTCGYVCDSFVTCQVMILMFARVALSLALPWVS